MTERSAEVGAERAMAGAVLERGVKDRSDIRVVEERFYALGTTGLVCDFPLWGCCERLGVVVAAVMVVSVEWSEREVVCDPVCMVGRGARPLVILISVMHQKSMKSTYYGLPCQCLISHFPNNRHSHSKLSRSWECKVLRLGQ